MNPVRNSSPKPFGRASAGVISNRVNHWYLWAIVCGFLFGVFVRSFVAISWYDVLFLVLLTLAILVVKRNTYSILFSVAILFAVAGMARMDVAMIYPAPEFEKKLGEKIVLEGYVFEDPDNRENNVRISLRVQDTGVLAIAPLLTSVQYGDIVRAEGLLRKPKSFLPAAQGTPQAGEAGEGRVFDYPAYLAKDGMAYELAFARVEVIGEGHRNSLRTAAMWIKHTYLIGLGRALPEPQAGLAGGITAGDKRALGGELSDIFRTVGLIHIVVLSGYNIMIVIGFIERVFSRAHRYVRFSLAICVAVFFALMTGLAASSVRAASMATIASIGKTTGRVYMASRALAVVAALMVLWNPYILAFDPGFQLSIIATWGLISVSPIVAGYLHFVTEKFSLREITASTIGTQIAVLPLLLYQSGQVSLIALPANLLALIAVPYAMFASFVAGVFGAIAAPLAPILGFPAYVLLSYLLLIAEWAAKIPLASVSVGTFSFATLVFSYIVLIAVVRIAARSKTNSYF